MVAENTPAVNSPTYYLTRAQLQQALECAIDGHQEYITQHGLSAEAAIVAGINEVFEGLDAYRELHTQDGEPLTLQLATPDPSATIAELMRQRDQALFAAHQVRHAQPGRYAFHFRHMALCYVLQHAPEVYNAAHADAYARIAAEGALGYEDVVARLEAQVTALRAAGAQAAQALHEAHDLLEQIPVVGAQPHGRFTWLSETGPRAIAALKKAGAV
jgi:hypothetical protein